MSNNTRPRSSESEKQGTLTILTWNVNGIRTLVPKDSDISHVLFPLKADICCFQETKTPRDQLRSTHATSVGWHSYFAFCKLPKRGGYSGVATFVKDGVCTIKTTTELHDQSFFGHDPGWQSIPWPDDLDREGRMVATDHGAAVLLNLYCPAVTAEDAPRRRERTAFKAAFHAAVRRRAEWLTKQGRSVIIVGDLNATASSLDTPECSLSEHRRRQEEEGKEQDEPTFSGRAWLRSLLGPPRDECGKGGADDQHSGAAAPAFLDSFRVFHPNRPEAFTCWNTKTDARALNHGARLDYLLLPRALAGYLEAADILPEVQGSDHCPAFLTLKAEDLGLWGGRGNFKPLAKPNHTPECTCFYPEYTGGRQQKLQTFFTKQKVRSSLPNSQGDDMPPPEVKPQLDNSQNVLEDPLQLPKQAAAGIQQKIPGTKRKRLCQKQASLKKFFGSQPKSCTSSVRKTDISIKCFVATSIQGEEMQPESTSTLSELSNQEAAGLRKAIELSKLDQKRMQQQPLSDSEQIVESLLTTADNEYIFASSKNENNKDQQCNSIKKHNSDSPLDQPLRQKDKREKNQASGDAWLALLGGSQGQADTVLCTGHGEPAVERVVKKPGPNRDRRFFVCKRPEGNFQKNKEARCDFFQWKNNNKKKKKMKEW